MSRSNYNTKLLNAISQDYSTQPYNSFVAPSNTSTPDPGSSTWGLYRISTSFDSDSTESAIALSPLQSIYVTPAAPTKEFPVTAKLTATFSITWSIDRPDLVELIILAGNVAFVRRLVPDYGTTPCGNLTVSGTVDGQSFSKTTALVGTSSDTITGIRTIIAKSTSISGGGSITSIKYQINGGSWQAFSTSPIDVAHTDSVAFKATFTKGSGKLYLTAAINIPTNGVSQDGSGTMTLTSGTCISSSDYTAAFTSVSSNFN